MTNKFSVENLVPDIPHKEKTTKTTAFFKSILLKKLNGIRFGRLTIVDGPSTFIYGDKGSEFQATVTVTSQEFYVFLGSGGTLGAAEAYTAGYWCADNLVSLVQIIIKNKKIMQNLESGFARLVNPFNKIIHKRRQNSIEGSKKNILAHYDLSNEFYQLWLDSTMTYSCGVFLNDDSSMKEASIEKLDRFCRKLKLTKDDKVLEIGTGWGSFALHAAKNYGCHVTTTTISDNQFGYVSDLINKEGLSSQIALLNSDYRELEGSFDKIISIEMIEAVGPQHIPGFFDKVSTLLRPGGLMALQGITYNDPDFEAYKNSVDFIRKYIFPGGCLVSVSQIKESIKAKTDLTLVDLEDITQHYARTIKHWRQDFLKSLPEIRSLGFSESFIRIWEFYLVYCEAGFLENLIGDFQFVFAKSDSKDIQITA